jgi:hypothetical protein
MVTDESKPGDCRGVADLLLPGQGGLRTADIQTLHSLVAIVYQTLLLVALLRRFNRIAARLA